MSGFDTTELDSFSQELFRIATEQMPKKTKKFMNQEGQKLKKRAKQKAKQGIKKKTGNYLKGIKKGKTRFSRGNASIRVYGDTNHSHLIEQGHNVKNKKDGAILGRARAFQILNKSTEEFQQEFQTDVQHFIDEVAEEL